MNTLTCNPNLSANFNPNRLFRLAESLWNESRPTNPAWTPLAEVTETDTAYAVKLDLPEVTATNVKVTVKDSVLRITGERTPAALPEGAPAEKVHLQERSYGPFSRSFSLPKLADPEQVTADFKLGVLTVSIQKRAEVSPKEIEVRVLA